MVPAGRTCNEFLTSLEVFPTLCRVTGATPPADVVLDGFDMMPVLAGARKSPRQEMFWERRDDRGARVGHWKWVQSDRGEGLFDLSNDIAEKRDLSKEKPDILTHVKSRFAAWKKQMDEAEPRGPFRDF
jgi:arylsulfatase A